MSTYDKVLAKGIEKGIEMKAREFVVNLIHSMGWNDARIALLAGVEEELVRDIRQQEQRASQ